MGRGFAFLIQFLWREGVWKVRGVWEKGEGDSFLGRFLMREKLKKVLCGVSVSHQVVALGGGRFFLGFVKG